jgi:hypothetical protein
MNLVAVQTWGRQLSVLKQFSNKPWFYPAALLLIGLLAHGYALLSLGFYWDDWEVVFLLNTKNPALLYGYFAFDRPFAWPYQLMGALAGLNPVGWHAATLLLRWAGIFLLYKSLALLWPRYDAYFRWWGALLIVYPGFFQQSVATAYNRHFTSFFIFAASIYFMILAIKRPKWWYVFYLGAWLTCFVQIFTIEYFAGLELVRPIFIWMALENEGVQGRKRAFKALFLSLPFLLLLGFYFWWRLILFPASLTTAQYAGDVKMLKDFQPSFVGGLFTLLTRAFVDLLYSTLQVWLEGLTRQDGFTFQSKVVWFAFCLAALISIYFSLFEDAEEKSDRPQSPFPMFVLGLLAFLASGLPIWLTTKQISGDGRWDDRFTLAPMFGAGLMMIALVIWLVRAQSRKFVLGVLLVFSIATQVIVVNKYRLDWEIQRNYYWQMHWRVPALQPGTAIFSFSQPSLSVPGYDTSFALNVLFDGKVVNGTVPYWFFTNDRFLNFDFKPGISISYTDRNLQFAGNTSRAIAILHQSETRCLEVLDTAYAGQPFYFSGEEALMDVSDVSRISSDAETAAPNPSVFGPEPAHGWCYYFERADLARQKQDWQTVVSLASQARERGLVPGYGSEYIPFIEAYARTGDWQKAYDSSLVAQKLTADLEPLLCSTWTRLGGLPAADAGFVDRAMQAFSCAAP